jgi:hypothetical protein
MEIFILPILLITMLFILKYILLKYNIIHRENTKKIRTIISIVAILIFIGFIVTEKNYKFNIIQVIIVLFMIYGVSKTHTILNKKE